MLKITISPQLGVFPKWGHQSLTCVTGWVVDSVTSVIRESEEAAYLEIKINSVLGFWSFRCLGNIQVDNSYQSLLRANHSVLYIVFWLKSYLNTILNQNVCNFCPLESVWYCVLGMEVDGEFYF